MEILWPIFLVLLFIGNIILAGTLSRSKLGWCIASLVVTPIITIAILLILGESKD
jgi:hypothetical protein